MNVKHIHITNITCITLMYILHESINTYQENTLMSKVYLRAVGQKIQVFFLYICIYFITHSDTK